MDEFDLLRAALADVKNISALARATKLSRKHIQRIRDGVVTNTTLKTMTRIREGMAKVQAEREAA